jgi:hypothetical protein
VLRGRAAADYRIGEKSAAISSLFSCRIGRTPLCGGHALPGARDASRTRALPSAVQIAVDAEHHLIVAHEVTNQGHDRSQLAPMALKAQEATGCERLAVGSGHCHTVRGLISGALKKKLGLDIVSEKTDRGRFYRISESRSAAR